MSDKLQKLQIQKIIQEYNYLRIDNQFKQQLREDNIKPFLKQVDEYKTANNIETPPKPAVKKQKEKLIADNQVIGNSKTKIKKVFREIVKLTHPDKTDSEDLVELYVQAKQAVENNDLMELYVIGTQLGVDIELDSDDVINLTRAVQLKREQIKNFESSYIWKWAHATSPKQKAKIIKIFVENM